MVICAVLGVITFVIYLFNDRLLELMYTLIDPTGCAGIGIPQEIPTDDQPECFAKQMIVVLRTRVD